MGVEGKMQAEKPAAWVQEEKSKQKSPPWKLIDRLRREKWAWREKGKRKNPRRGRRKRKASKKAQMWSQEAS